MDIKRLKRWVLNKLAMFTVPKVEAKEPITLSVGQGKEFSTLSDAIDSLPNHIDRDISIELHDNSCGRKIVMPQSFEEGASISMRAANAFEVKTAE